MSRAPFTYSAGSPGWASEAQVLGTVNSNDAASLNSSWGWDDVYGGLRNGDGAGFLQVFLECPLVVRKQFRDTRLIVGASFPVEHSGTFTFCDLGFWVEGVENVQVGDDGDFVETDPILSLHRTIYHAGTRVRRYLVWGEVPIERFIVGSFTVYPAIRPYTAFGGIISNAGDSIHIWAREVK